MIPIPRAIATRWLKSRMKSRADGALPSGLCIGASMMVRGTEPMFTVRMSIVDEEGFCLSRDDAPALPERPCVGMSRTERLDEARGKHSSVVRELSGRMVIVGVRTSRDESRTTTRFPRETSHGSGASDCEYVARVGSRSCDWR